jgi:hypothetical protein
MPFVLILTSVEECPCLEAASSPKQKRKRASVNKIVSTYFRHFSAKCENQVFRTFPSVSSDAFVSVGS